MSKLSLSEISDSVELELSEFNKLFRESLRSKVLLLELITRYIHKQKGKKIRPLLVLLSSKVCGSIGERSYRGASLVELLHTATLVHDDVVDNAETRRGFPSVNAVWKNKIAVLLGDYLLARGLMLAVDGNDFDFLRVITNTVRRMSEGELHQINKTRKLNIDEESYFQIISDKTASLLSTCCEIGARAATEDQNKIEAMKMFGENLGIAFQIRDDILDLVGTKKVFGKPLGGDIKEKKLTLPLIYALKKSSDDERKNILKMIKKGATNSQVEEVISFVVKHDGINYADAVAKDYANRALKNLELFENSTAKSSLESIIDFVVERIK